MKGRGPLSGYRIVEMAHHLAAPLAAMAQLGAHTREILTELKYRSAGIRRLSDAKIVRVT